LDWSRLIPEKKKRIVKDMKTFDDLKRMCQVQVQVRNCEIEGMIWSIENVIGTLANNEIISFDEENELLEILRS